MNSLRKPLLAAAGLALVLGGGAYAASKYPHHIAVRLPDGEIAQVEYVGDVAPRVVVQPVAAVPVARAPGMAIGFPGFAGFGNIDRIFADMQRQQAAMMSQVAAMQHAAAHGGAAFASGQRPANGVHWSYVSSMTSSNGCTQTVEWRSGGAANAASQPQMIRTSSGSCDKAVKDTPVHAASAVKQAPAVPDNKTV